jgi:ubiquitin conjugation factor E4 B
MLNYFLLYLTGPERRKLKVANPEKYQFNPKELLAQIATVYVRLDRWGGGRRVPREEGGGGQVGMKTPAGCVASFCPTACLPARRSDPNGALAAAIAADGRSYREEMFAEAGLVIRQFGLLPEQEVRPAALPAAHGGGGGLAMCQDW